MFSKLTLQERYYIFVSICLVWMMGHQSYYTYRADELIHEALEEGNNLAAEVTLGELQLTRTSNASSLQGSQEDA